MVQMLPNGTIFSYEKVQEIGFFVMYYAKSWEEIWVIIEILRHKISSVRALRNALLDALAFVVYITQFLKRLQLAVTNGSTVKN